MNKLSEFNKIIKIKNFKIKKIYNIDGLENTKKGGSIPNNEKCYWFISLSYKSHD